MGYIAVVLLQTLILPVAFGARSGDLLELGRWFLFWGVGTRLALAGIVQLAKPDFTTGAILGEAPSASLTTRELGFANVAIGAGAIVGTFCGGGLAAAITGGAYLGFAGFAHLGKSGKNAKEQVATWTDLLVFAAMAAYVVALLARRQ